MGGSALRHKMDLASFLLEKFDHQKGEEEAKKVGWKGGNEENFIKMVREIEYDGGSKGADKLTNADHVKMIPPSDKVETKVDATKDKPRSPKGEKVPTKLDLPPKDWQQLQETLIKSNLLPKPIPLTQTARGHSGLPPNETPALNGAKRGTISCPDTDPKVQEVLSSMLAFWNDPRGTRDEEAAYPSIKGYNSTHHTFMPPPLPYADKSTPLKSRIRKRYLTFEPDTGGWNNLRMSFENLLLYAAVSGRTLVLPPDQNIYLLEPKKGEKRRGR